MDFPIDIDFTPGKIQVHKDITVATRNAIIERGLKAGQRMPSAKEMAAQLGVSRTTMVKVYQQLAAEGLVETRIGSGTYIRNDGCPEQLHRSEPEMRNANILANLSKQALQLLKLSRSQSNASNALPISFHTAASDVLPVRQWQQILSRHCRLSDISNPAVDDESALESRHPFGHLPLRQALASFLTRVKALNCSADRIIVFEGTPQAFDFISTLLIDEDDLAIVEAPGRVAALNALVARKAKICKVATDENGLDTGKLDQIEQPCKLVYLSPSHAEQSGAVMSMSRRKSLLDWAERVNATIIEDATDSDYYYGKNMFPALQGLDKTDRVIYLYDFSRVLYPYVNIAVAVIPNSMIEVARNTMLMRGAVSPSIEHFALADFIAEGDLQRHIRRSRKDYQSRRQTVIYHLTRHFRDQVSIPNHSAGLHQIVRFNLDLSVQDILSCARGAALPLVSLSQDSASGSKVSAGHEFALAFALLDSQTSPLKIAKFKDLIDERQRDSSVERSVPAKAPEVAAQVLPVAVLQTVPF